MFGAVSQACLLVVVVLSVASAVHAQTDRGTLTGQVTDQTAAIIPGASVKAIHVATNFERQVITSDEGSYTITQLPVGMLRRHRYSPELSNDDPGERRGYCRQHRTRGCAACRGRRARRRDGDLRGSADTDGQREGARRRSAASSSRICRWWSAGSFARRSIWA